MWNKNRTKSQTFRLKNTVLRHSTIVYWNRTVQTKYSVTNQILALIAISIMKKTYLILLLLSCSYSFCQESNLRLIDNAKTKLSAKKINKLLVGVWFFEKLTDATTSKEIGKVNHEISDDLSALEIVKRPSVRINKDGTYEQFDCPAENCETGKWNYKAREKVLSFKFNEPKYNVPIDRLAPGLLEKLKASGQLIISDGFEWEIAEISKTKLVIIEHLPHNEFELKYNLRIYIKK